MAQEYRPLQIQGCRLDRLALVYIRQSVLRHVSEHPGSTEDQSQIDLALKWGWPIERIKALDEPLGSSGIRAEGRNEFQRLLRLVRQGRVGCIFLE